MEDEKYFSSIIIIPSYKESKYIFKTLKSINEQIWVDLQDLLVVVVVNNRVNLKLFYDQVVTDYVVSSSFPTSNTNVGLSLRFTLM